MELDQLQPSNEKANHLPFLVEDPFRDRSPYASRPSSFRAPSTRNSSAPKIVRKFKSSRLLGVYEKPWLENRDPRMKWDRIIFWFLAFVGIGIGTYTCYTGWQATPDQNFCLKFEDNFQNGIDPNNWNYDIQLAGFGTGSFDWTTSDKANAYTDSEGLHIVPTMTTETTDITTEQLFNGHTVNLTIDGTCTSTNYKDCSVASNETTLTMINPVRSARLTTRGKQTLRYGKVEVVAKLPKGDWLWPAIWMMPEESIYGVWPRSGEIDIMEARGNSPTAKYGRSLITSALHWGPSSDLDMFVKTMGERKSKRVDYSEEFHTFGLQWSPKYMFAYIDNPLKQVAYVAFGGKLGDMYSRGGFGKMDYKSNGPPGNPWGLSTQPNAPFDQNFYLILNVAVGGTSGYFSDGVDGKPWADKENATMLRWWNARPAWEPTWGKGDTRGMTVKSVKMWQRC